MLMRERAAPVPQSGSGAITPTTPQRTPSSAMLLAAIHLGERESQRPEGWWRNPSLRGRFIGRRHFQNDIFLAGLAAKYQRERKPGLCKCRGHIRWCRYVTFAVVAELKYRIVGDL